MSTFPLITSLSSLTASTSLSAPSNAPPTTKTTTTPPSQPPAEPLEPPIERILNHNPVLRSLLSNLHVHELQNLAQASPSWAALANDPTYCVLLGRGCEMPIRYCCLIGQYRLTHDSSTSIWSDPHAIPCPVGPLTDAKLYRCDGWKLGFTTVHGREFWVCKDATDLNPQYPKSRIKHLRGHQFRRVCNACVATQGKKPRETCRCTQEYAEAVVCLTCYRSLYLSLHRKRDAQGHRLTKEANRLLKYEFECVCCVKQFRNNGDWYESKFGEVYECPRCGVWVVGKRDLDLMVMTRGVQEDTALVSVGKVVARMVARATGEPLGVLVRRWRRWQWACDLLLAVGCAWLAVMSWILVKERVL